MTQSMPTPREQQATTSHSVVDEQTNFQRLMELVEAEDAANGEVSCGRDWGDQLSVYLKTCSINISDEKLRTLLREYLGHRLIERDFDSIMTQLRGYIESLLVEVPVQSTSAKLSPAPSEQVTEHIPTKELRQCIQSELGEFCSETALGQITQFTHQLIHKAILHPRHTWPQPIWVLKTGEKVYIAQASNLEAAITKVRAQYPQETGSLEILTVGGVMAPDQVISLDRATL